MLGDFEIDFSQKKVLLLGFGLEGRASLKYLKEKFPTAIVSVADQAKSFSIESEVRSEVSEIYKGESWLSSLSDYDIIVRSPGVPLGLIESAVPTDGTAPIMTSVTEIFLEKNRSRTIGITGTKGKSTTSSLLKEILAACGFKVELVGNIGKPAISLINEKVDYFIYELSSYQLQDLKYSPHVAFFLNFYPEHLDHHGGIENYFSAKCRIFDFQEPKDFLFLGQKVLPQVVGKPRSSLCVVGGPESKFFIKGSSIVSRDGSFMFDMKSSGLRGSGNLQNLLAVFEFAASIDLDLDLVSRGISQFKPLPHRLEIVGTRNGVQYVNDSISTVPQATINAIDAFDSQIQTLILGGYDRGVDFDELSDVILESEIPLVLLFKPSGERILSSINRSAKSKNLTPPTMQFVDSMDHAIKVVIEKNFKSGVCLLSPASPSFGMFKNFEERGKTFRDIVLSVF